VARPRLPCLRGSGRSALPGARSVDADAGQTGSGGWLDVHPESPSLLHELVCLAAIEDAREVALATLKRGIAIKPQLRSWARKDEDYRTLHQDPNSRS
jgi:hypothetical protein